MAIAWRWLCCCLLVGFALSLKAAQQPLHVAVASNFQQPFTQLKQAFEQQHPKVHIRVSHASSGILYTQIVRGAPFVLFLSADKQRAQLLVQQGLATTSALYTHGRLLLWAPKAVHISRRQLLASSGRIALAQADIAPYGLATEQALKKLGVWQKWQSRLVWGKSVAQVANLVQAGAVSMGFVSDFQASTLTGGKWLVDSDLYQPIEQHMALVGQHRQSDERRLALALYQFILSAQGQALIQEQRFNPNV